METDGMSIVGVVTGLLRDSDGKVSPRACDRRRGSNRVGVAIGLSGGGTDRAGGSNRVRAPTGVEVAIGVGVTSGVGVSIEPRWNHNGQKNGGGFCE